MFNPAAAYGGEVRGRHGDGEEGRVRDAGSRSGTPSPLLGVALQRELASTPMNAVWSRAAAPPLTDAL